MAAVKHDEHQAIGIEQVDPGQLAYASKLREALTPTWHRISNPVYTRGEIERLGCDDFGRVVGRPISPRHFRRLLKLIQSRGGGRGESDSIADYLPRSIRTISTPAPRLPSQTPGLNGRDVAALEESIALLKDPLRPTTAEKAWFWEKLFQAWENGVARGEASHRFKSAIIGWVFPRVPGLASTQESLRRLWNMKVEAWNNGGRSMTSLKDLRCVSRKAEPLLECDRKVIEMIAVFETGGRLAQAYLLARIRGKLSQSFLDRFPDTGTRKSYVPEAVRREIAPGLPALLEFLRGPRTAHLAGAFLTRDWSGVAAGDWYQGDDVTLPVYYYVEDASGIRLTRGQFLLMIDLRSRRVLDFVLIDEKSYNSLHIRKLMNRVCSRFGLPRRGFYFERGIWQRSKAVTGGIPSGLPGVPEIEGGFRALGLEFIHARTPRAKVVEGIIGILQNRMEAMPGYVGRNEMIDKFEGVQEAKLEVESGRKHPAAAGFLSADEWFQRLQDLVASYNAESAESDATGGRSPDGAWRDLQDATNPLAKLPPEARHLLATHRTVRKIGRQGLVVTVGRRDFVYQSEETGRLRGQQVIAWFDPESPEFCCITDLEKRNPRTVPLAPSVPAMGASREELSDAMARIEQHQAPIRERYSRLRADFVPTTRPNIVAPSTAALGIEMERQRAEAKAATREKQSRQRKVRNAVGRFLPPDLASADAAEVAEDPERAEAAIRLAKLLQP